MWDLRESTSLHRATEVEEAEYSLRYPTYDTGKYLFFVSKLDTGIICTVVATLALPA